MKVAISARLLKAVPDDGISRFTYEVVKRLLANHKQHSYVLVFDSAPDNRLDFGPDHSVEVIKPASRHPFLWYTWHEWQLPAVLARTGADVFFSPDGIISIRSQVPAVPVIHDINFLHRPDDIPFLTRSYYRTFFSIFAHKAARILTVSNFCRNDIAGNLKIDPVKIDVAYNGVSEYFSPVPSGLTSEYRNKLTGGIPYFLFVGNFSPRKNIPSLIKAYNDFRLKSISKHKLVLAGGRLYLNSETDRLLKLSPFREDIIVTGSMDHKDLHMLYASALSLVFVPWFEGFGIPAAEAMRCGTPVILSDTTSLPEVGGNAAVYTSPGDIEGIADAMLKIAADNALREELSGKGILKSSEYSWDKTAADVALSLEKAFGHNT
ncbi:MAG TPA: glycosyltransferase family 1 protein [Bacteroidales bacterium]|nr:glycosyltransferase family 1 protein [Bacteroidales bacterium]